MKFDIEIALESIDIAGVLSSMPDFEPDKILTVDNWNYENEADISGADINSLSVLIDNGKILQIYAASGRDGAFFYSDNGRYICDLFFECADKTPDSSDVNEHNKDFYFKALDFVTGHFAKFGIYYAAFGCELSVSDKLDISKKIADSHNVHMWLINKDILVNTQEKYTQLERNNFTVFIKN